MPLRKLKYPELAGLPRAERQKEQVKRWVQEQNADPAKRARLRERNTENKRKNRELKRAQKNGQVVPTDSAGGSSNVVRLSNGPAVSLPLPQVSSSDPQLVPIIPIDPVLLLQPSSSHSTRDAATMVDPPPTAQGIMAAKTSHTCDVSIMTETPSENSYPLPNQPQLEPALPTLSTLPELNLDLASDIIGVQVPEQSETVEWSDGHITVLPCIWEDGINICKDDVAYVKFLAQLPQSLPSSAYVVHAQYCDWSSKPMELHELVNATLREGKCFLLHGLPKPEPAKLDVDYLERYGMSSMRPIVAHDVKARVANFTYPHKDSTIQQFIGNVHNPNIIQCVLDLPFSQGGLPFFFSTLDHGMVYAWNLTLTCKPQSVHPDNFLVKAWALLHHAGFLTYFHHDSDGGNTYVKVENHSGVKFWCLAFPKDGHSISRTALSANFALFANLKKNRKKIESKWDFEVVTVLPGDLLIQPPGQFHAVYTPVATFATGGHFYNHQYMHLTELSRYVDHTKGTTFTNQIHEHSIATFQRMIINLPYLPSCIMGGLFSFYPTRRGKAKPRILEVVKSDSEKEEVQRMGKSEDDADILPIAPIPACIDNVQNKGKSPRPSTCSQSSSDASSSRCYW
ncbi:hypothetical protein DFJ58DRAFT_734920 [Suillus subalutaceus]|uniref:uncharacterized protein n=1 Tax=Suillus subalutaceus TaxID=48586 RepID=UPI001B86696D|nr:uncharacterized protein DFJ58DRAFT_734920 [Suillus subalutaceus]KAG1836496.1 hypothetical protein DFJ58DRAFT_734920 [Suillus subalutaceus]